MQENGETSKAGQLPVLYLIFSHNNQKQLLRLANAIKALSPNSLLAIHHDPSHEDFQEFQALAHLGVHLIPEPVAGQWGAFSLVEQYIHAMKWCAAHLDFSWCCTITGLSYPIASLETFERNLQRSEYDAFLYHFDAFDPSHWPPGTAETRYKFRYYNLPKFPYAHRLPSALRKFFDDIRRRFNSAQRIFRIMRPGRSPYIWLGIRRVRTPINTELRLYGGRQMLNIKRSALLTVLEYIKQHPEWTRYMSRTFIPDEAYFTTIICNTKSIRTSNESLRFIKWPQGHASSGAVITEEDLPAVFDSGLPFGLKFDPQLSSKALDLVDQNLDIAAKASIDDRPIADQECSHAR